MLITGFFTTKAIGSKGGCLLFYLGRSPLGFPLPTCSLIKINQIKIPAVVKVEVFWFAHSQNLYRRIEHNV
jgi:hypothetical protein